MAQQFQTHQLRAAPERQRNEYEHNIPAIFEHLGVSANDIIFNHQNRDSDHNVSLMLHHMTIEQLKQRASMTGQTLATLFQKVGRVEFQELGNRILSIKIYLNQN